ncbi:cytochrome bc1 complex Rieske iron-sulfur subunit [Kineococcus sp. SYSU DK006]|uniref:cytochrome bc1 complex Rieske iron-sulfur subunit n=1 Tax=Kineococcus sp. SYSU DK006 TaxID=3383127 RepID=UPI003D7D374F
MSDIERAEEAHGQAGTTLAKPGGGLPDRFENPGLPPHQHRMGDTDPKAAKRAERQVAILLLLSMIGSIGIIVSIIAIKYDGSFDRIGLSTRAIGLSMFLSLFALGVGAVHWAKTLMPDDERIDYRHRQRGTDAERAEAVAILKEGAGEAALGRRPLIRNTLVGALALFPIPAVFFFRDTGPLPGDDLSTTMWKAGDYLVKDPEGGRIRAADVSLGSVVHVLPEGIEDVEDVLNQKAKAAVLLMRLEEGLLTEKSADWGVDGTVAYSKICTHMGCPVALYEQQTHHLLCPCHQSTFDLTQDCKVIFGPAKRRLPQLPIEVDDEGYLRASSGFHEAVGPSFWERG